MNTTEELMSRSAEELKQLPDSIFIELTLVNTLAIIGALQLALRHPLYVGPSRASVITFVKQVQAVLRERGAEALVEIIDRGWNPQNDPARTSNFSGSERDDQPSGP